MHPNQTMADIADLKSTIEGLLFISGEGLTLSDIAKGLGEENERVKMLLDSLIDDYLERDGGIVLRESGGKYQFVTHPRIYPSVQAFLREKKKESLSRAMLETLAI